MVNDTFPTLLKHRATLVGSLGRYDLILLGGSYLVLSWMKVSGLYALAINIGILLVLKFTQRRLRAGFFRFLATPRRLKWAYKLEDSHGYNISNS